MSSKNNPAKNSTVVDRDIRRADSTTQKDKLDDALNLMLTSTASIVRENTELKAEVQRLTASVEAVRSENMQMRQEQQRERLEDRAMIKASIAKIERLSQWMRLPPSPGSSTLFPPCLESRKRPHDNEGISLVDLAPSASSSIQQSSVALPPPPVAAAASVSTAASVSKAATTTKRTPGDKTTTTTVSVTKRMKFKTKINFNPAGQTGGNTIEDIIRSAYLSGCFKPTVAFIGLSRPVRFTETAKYNHCLHLFEAVATADHRSVLGKTDLDSEGIDHVSRSIADACMARLEELEGAKRATRANEGKGYTGVGRRVQTIKKTYPNLHL